jgi:hypothetical protein
VCAGQGDEDTVQFRRKIRMSTATRSGSALVSERKCAKDKAARRSTPRNSAPLDRQTLKGKVFPVHAIKTRKSEEVQLHSFLTLAVERAEVGNFRSRPLYPRQGTPLPFEYDAPEPVWKISISDKYVAPTGIRTPDRSQLLCRLNAHFMEPEGSLPCSRETATSLS